jgi:hypothetical protein
MTLINHAKHRDLDADTTVKVAALADIQLVEFDGSDVENQTGSGQFQGFDVRSVAERQTRGAGTLDLAAVVRRLTPPAPRDVEPRSSSPAIVQSTSGARQSTNVALGEVALAELRGAGMVVVRGIVLIVFATAERLQEMSRRLPLSFARLLARLAHQGRSLALAYRSHRGDAWVVRAWAGKLFVSTRARLLRSRSAFRTFTSPLALQPHARRSSRSRAT